MRVRLAVVFFALASAASAAELPDPAACANYDHIKTGSDADCDTAITKETDPAVKSVLLWRRAYIIIDRKDFKTYPNALADLDEAIRLLPANWRALGERAYLYNEYGRWVEARRDSETEIALRPQGFHGYQERALSRFKLGDLQGSFEDRNTVVTLRPGLAGPLVGRAEARLWLGQFDEAKADLDAAADIAKRTQDQTVEEDIEGYRAELALLTKTSGKNPAAQSCSEAAKKGEFQREGLVGDCTRAFLEAKTATEKADALTSRSIARIIATQDETSAIGDRTIAVALDPDNPDLHANLGFSYIAAHHSSAAVTEFDRSIALKPTFIGYAGRASAKFNLNDIDGAFFDAKKSFEIKPNILSFWVLGDCVYARTKVYDNAKKYWIAAYRLGSRDDRLIARLKDAGVPIPPPEDASSTP
jgi:tetratricopeptide (TPR) repeat protein